MMKKKLLVFILLFVSVSKVDSKIIVDVKSNKETANLALTLILGHGNDEFGHGNDEFGLLTIRPGFKLDIICKELDAFFLYRAFWVIDESRPGEQAFYRPYDYVCLRGALLKSEILNVPLNDTEFVFVYNERDSYCDVRNIAEGLV